MNLTASSQTGLRSDLDLFEIKPGVKFSASVLQAMLPDTETLLFFGKVYDLTAVQLSALLRKVFNQSDLVAALTSGSHSTELQDYLVDIAAHISDVQEMLAFDAGVKPQGEILPELWANLEVEVAASLKTVASKLEGVIGSLPGKKAEMVFRSMAVMNKKRPVLGDFRASIHRGRRQPNLVILDDSGSMSHGTVTTILKDVVSLSFMADAHLALVSSSTRLWEPGAYGVEGVKAAIELQGTHYETLLPLLHQDWGTVITIADYDSSESARRHIADNARGTIEEVVDISLVNKPTFLAECVGQLAKKVRPILVASDSYTYGPLNH